jgi:signal transduction histidine kinase
VLLLHDLETVHGRHFRQMFPPAVDRILVGAVRWVRRVGGYAVGASGAVAVIGLIASLTTLGVLHDAELRTADREMDRRVAAARASVEAEARRYVDATGMAAAGLAALPEITPAGFTAVTDPVAALHLPGAAAAVFLVPATPERVPAVEADWRRRGADVTLRPTGAGAGPQHEHLFVVLGRTLDPTPMTVVGSDTTGVAELSEVLMRARERGAVSLSAPYVLMRDRALPAGRQQKSFVLAVPVPEPTGGLRGWLLLALRGNALMSGVLAHAGTGRLDVRLAAGQGAGAFARYAGDDGGRHVGETDLVRSTVVPVADRKWILHATAERATVPGAATHLDESIALTLLLLTVICAVFVYVLGTGRTRLARRVEAAVAESRARQAAIERLNDDLRRRGEELEERVAERTREVEAQAQELREANADLESFSYSVSHDLRAPLRAIDGFAKMLELDHAARMDPAGRRCIQRVRAGAARMSEQIDALLAFSRMQRQAMERQPVHMADLIDDVWEELAGDLDGRTVELVTEPLPAVDGDPRLVRHVVANLIGNAVKYTRGRDVARVTVGGEPGDDGEVTFHVSDNGAGFDMRYADRLFQVFQRLHRAEEYEGTGVGLALAARIVHRHGGRIWAEAAPGEGATFYFTLTGTDSEERRAVVPADRA